MTPRRRFIVGLASLGAAAGLGYALRAARAAGIPAANAMSYAGVLEDANGPINGMHNILLYAYDAATNGNVLCQTTPAALNIVNGRFAVQLPDTCTTAIGANSDAWIDVLVDGSDTGRSKIGAVPYAVEANHAVNATNATNATTAATAQAAGGALQTSLGQMQSAISTLQSAPPPFTTIHGDCLNTTDPATDNWQNFATQCLASDTSSSATIIEACVVAANRKCVGLGYAEGWLTGELGAGCVAISCIK